jgi:hypothetical protein
VVGYTEVVDVRDGDGDVGNKSLSLKLISRERREKKDTLIKPVVGSVNPAGRISKSTPLH